MHHRAPAPLSVHHADWLDLARSLPPGSIDLLYVDPPFNTGEVRRTPPRAAAAGRTLDASFEDAWPSLDAWLDWLGERLAATLPALRPSGSILLHVDWRTSHRARVLLDDLLGPDRFVNHLIWSYGLGGSSARRFARKHDDILFYALHPRLYHFEPPRVPATSRRLRGRMKKSTDVLSIPALNNMSRQRTGYPTQKPLELLELLVAACCPAGGVVLDPCCGSGTTLEAAARTGRRWIGGDRSAVAVGLASQRLGVAPTHTLPGATEAGTSE